MVDRSKEVVEHFAEHIELYIYFVDSTSSPSCRNDCRSIFWMYFTLISVPFTKADREHTILS